VTDGVNHLAAAGRADGRRICIAGASYGGYAALAGAAFTPDLYRCAISQSGLSDLFDLVRDERRYGGRQSAGFDYLRQAIGDPDRDRETLIAISPRHQAHRITIPVLLIHGEADGVAPFEHSQNMERALREAGKQVRLIPIAHGGHSPSGWEPDQRAMVYREIESFLAAHLNAPK
jgi:dipeptidyl aminopeptidase/acylaminoacyl peptidase